MSDAERLLEAALAGDRRSLARAITRVEALDPQMGLALAASPVRRRSGPGRPHVVGLTGPPGAGKSTFADAWVEAARAVGLRVAVVAVDPSSPFSGGAILGDRIRMERHTGDPGVYLRSLSSRGRIGGVSAACGEVVDLLDAAGFDEVLVETVGVGQSELSVMEVADTVVVLLTPESGDTIQAMKAGLLEIADLFAVNKADRAGAGSLARILAQAVALETDDGWPAPVLLTSAHTGTGVTDVRAAAGRHLAWCVGAGRPSWEHRRAEGRIRQFLDLVADHARRGVGEVLAGTLGREIRSGLAPRVALARWLAT